MTITAEQIDPASVQERVDGECEVGSAIRAINADGSVECEVDDDQLGTLSCGSGQLPKWDDGLGQWACGDSLGRATRACL